MASGPCAGLGDLLLPVNEPGSSIMPGKVNPTQAEALAQVCIRVIGNDTTVSLAEGLLSNLELNLAKPLIIVTVLESIQILSRGPESFTERCLRGLQANEQKLSETLDRSLMLVTRLSPIIGYDCAAQVAESALASGGTIRETVQEMGIQIPDIDELLDPHRMAFPESNWDSRRRNGQETEDNHPGDERHDRTEA